MIRTILAAFTLAGPVSADCELFLAFSDHGNLPGTYNETHPGFRCSKGNVTGTFYKNSEGDYSAALGLIGRHEFGPVTGFVEGGVVTGYEMAPVVPYVRAGLEYDNLRFFIAPTATVKGEVGIVGGVEFIAVRF